MADLTEMEAFRREQRQLLSALATKEMETSSALALQTRALDEHRTEVRELGDAVKELLPLTRSMVESGAAREKRAGQAFQRLTRLSREQAAALFIAALSIPATIAGLILSLTDPGRVLDTLVVIVDALPMIEVDPSQMPNGGPHAAP